MFADDTKCYRPVKDLPDCESLQNDLNNLVNWCTIWKMDLNKSKCGVMSFTRSRQPVATNYKLLDSSLRQLCHQKDLGIVVTKDLKWTKQVEEITSKASSMLGFIRRTASDTHNIHVRKVLYLSLVRSKLGYASQNKYTTRTILEHLSLCASNATQLGLLIVYLDSAVEESEAGNQDSYNENVSFEQSSESEKSSESHSLEKSSELHSKESKAGNQDSYNENVSFEQSSEAEKSSESHSLEYLNNRLEALNKAVSTNTAAIKSLIENTNDNSNNEPNATIKNYTGETSKQSETQDSVDCAGQTKEVLNPNIQVSNRFSNLNTEESNADDVDVTQNDLVTAHTEPATKPKQVNEKYNRRHHTGSKETKQTYHHPRPNVAIVGDSMLKHINPTQLRRSTRSFNTQIKTFPGAKVSDMEYYVKPTLARTPDHLILHVGTNDVRQSTPQEITNAISMLGQQIKKELPTTNLAISEVITRNDDPSLNTKITELNTKLSQ
ncbi:Hypothetical predicted protein, partial [Paramuricea clavata]